MVIGCTKYLKVGNLMEDMTIQNTIGKEEFKVIFKNSLKSLFPDAPSKHSPLQYIHKTSIVLHVIA